MNERCSATNREGQPCGSYEYADGLCWIHYAHMAAHGTASGEPRPVTYPCAAYTASGQRCAKRGRLNTHGPAGWQWCCHVHYYPHQARRLAAEARAKREAQLRVVPEASASRAARRGAK